LKIVIVVASGLMMKIEIGESLVRSWLRHVEHCEFAELNWKPSPTWEARPNEHIEGLFEKAVTEWPEAFGRNSLSQLLKQAEIDVLGLNTASSKLHLVDVAFHSGGLNYGGQGETGKRIYKKLVRSALLASTYFANQEFIIYFVTPVLSPGIKAEVEVACERVKAVFTSETKLTFQLILGDDFKTNLLDDVLALNSEVADTSELFLRSWQLIKPFIQLVPESQDDLTVELQNPNNNRRDMHIVALYLSRFGHLDFEFRNQKETFRSFGLIFGVAGNTVKNTRDRFDRYVDNHRAGWDVPLLDNLQVILDEYGESSKDELSDIVFPFVVNAQG
jgi:hypothetical protein